jgi:hypothetical protein
MIKYLEFGKFLICFPRIKKLHCKSFLQQSASLATSRELLRYCSQAANAAWRGPDSKSGRKIKRSIPYQMIYIDILMFGLGGNRSYRPKRGIAAVPVPRLTLYPEKNKLCFCCKSRD